MNKRKINNYNKSMVNTFTMVNTLTMVNALNLRTIEMADGYGT